MGAESLREAGEERVGNRIHKGAGVRRNRKYILQHCVIFHNKKAHKGGTTKWRGTGGREPGSNGVGSLREKRGQEMG